MSKITLALARAHWHRRQGLAAPLNRAVPQALPGVVARSGWVRTLGGADVYLALRARAPKMQRAELDAAVAASELQVVPAVRGCIYLVPRAHVGFALRFAESIWRKSTERDLEKVGSGWKEVEELARAVMEVLTPSGLSTDALRKALPPGTVRSFGDAGKKVGVSSPLPLALRHAELQGEVERTLEGGRLDTERYVWRRAKKNAFAAGSVPDDAASLAARIGEIFFAQMGPATAADFAEWSGLSLREAKAGLSRLPLAPVDVEGYSDKALVIESEVAELTHGRPPGEDAVTLLSFEDNLLTVHGGPALFVDPKEHGRKVSSFGTSRPVTLGEAKHLMNRTLVVADRIAGFWELDTEARRIVVAPFAPLSTRTRRLVEQVAESTATFLLDQVGHGRAFALDDDEARLARLAVVQKMLG